MEYRTLGRTGVEVSPFSRVEGRAATIFTAPFEAAKFRSLKSYLRHGTVRQSALIHVYRVAGCSTRIEIPAEAPNYERIDAAQALALLRELPDPRLVRRLHLSDEPCFLDPWMRRMTGRELYHLGNATNRGLVVLYRPDRHQGAELGITLSTSGCTRFQTAAVAAPLQARQRGQADGADVKRAGIVRRSQDPGLRGLVRPRRAAVRL